MTPVFRHGRLRLYLLRLLDEEPRHGYEVIRLLRDRFMGIYAPSPGTIYPRLARLEEEGLVTHDEENGRKVYRITEAGREELRNRGDELDELEEELSASVSDIVREVREDVRDTVRSLREELTRAAREMRGSERDARDQAREQGRAASGGRRASAARAARGQRRRQAAAATQARGRRASRPARRATRRSRTPTGSARRRPSLRDDAREQWSGGWGNWSEWSPNGQAAAGLARPARPRRAPRLRAAGPRLRDRPARRRRDSGSLLGSDVIPTLRDILADTLDRIRTEVFEPHHDIPQRPRRPPGPQRPRRAASAPSRRVTASRSGRQPAPDRYSLETAA